MRRCSIVVSIHTCHVGDPGSIPGNCNFNFFFFYSFNGGQRRTCRAGSFGSIPNNASLTKVGIGLLFLKYGL